MTTLLHIDSSPLYGRSVSRQLAEAFVTQWKAAHPGQAVLTRDLNATAIPPLDADWIAASFTPASDLTAAQHAKLSQSEELLAELAQADEYLIGVPMHNFSIPAVLKLWIDQVSRAGKTFSYVDGTPKGLLVGKKATFIVATGADFAAHPEFAAFDFVQPYLRALFGFLGVTDATFLTAGGTMALNYGLDRDAFLAPHLETVRAHAQAA